MQQTQSIIKKIHGKTFLLISVFFLASCGGSGGEGDSGDPLPGSQPPGSTTPTPASVANADSYFVQRNQPLNVSAQSGLLSNDDLVTSSQAEVMLVTQPAFSSQFNLNPDGSFLYVHNGDNGTSDSFNYQVNDGTGRSNIATVRLVITEALTVQNTCLDTPLNTDLSGNLSDYVNGGQTVGDFTQVGMAPKGTVLIDPTTGKFTYTPSSGMRGLDKFTFEVTDQSGAKASGTVEIIVAQMRVKPLGDSITQGPTQGLTIAEDDNRTASDREMVGYRAKLYEALVSKGYKIDFVGSQSNGLGASPAIGDPDHEGHGGIEDGEVAAVIYDWMSENPADFVLLHIGQNGLTRPGETSSSDVEMILNEIDRWEADTSTQVAVFLAYIIDGKDPTNNDAIPNPRVAEFNTNLETLVLGPGGSGGGRVDTGDDITMVNQHDALSYPNDLSVDLVHPLPVGYEKMANTWLEALENSEKLPSCTSAN